MEDAQDETSLQTIVYTYHDTAERISAQIATMRTTRGAAMDVTYSYTYDNNGNILTVSDGTNTTSYVYDSANQLIRENNQAAGKTWTWTYDSAGNILSKNEYAYTTGDLGTPIDTIPYTYNDADWGDLLTAYDGTAITYDTIGNPLNDGTWTYTWQNGRELATMSDGTVTWRYTYDANGMRTRRSGNNVPHGYEYIYNGGSLSQVIVDQWQTLKFTYDANGIPMTVNYENEDYYYITNLQGDVLGIADSTGALVVSYTYDAWGKPLSITGSMADTLGVQNPLRYRGYVYDQETGLYYLQSRYYDPEIGRFINADACYDNGKGILRHNMFAYCGNNPVMRADPEGESWVLVGILVISALLLSGCEPETKPESPKPNVEPYSSYGSGKGNVYIVTEDKVSEVVNTKSDTDVIIVDYRTNEDPNMQIRQSYKITNPKHQKEIANIMDDYNSENPVNPAWSRTVDSILDEWSFHNLAYSLGYKRDRTADTDFNNSDEGKGFWDFVGR